MESPVNGHPVCTRPPGASVRIERSEDPDAYACGMALDSIELTTLSGDSTTWGDAKGKATLVVNVASHCGNTPQYEGLQRLYETYHERGLEILGFPCNQFGLQEPGRAE